jgi:signal transduction histidine kinase/PAS domain-containing protein
MTDNNFIYLLVPIIVIESALGAFVYSLTPWAKRNRLFVLLMVVLILYNIGLLLAATAVDPTLILFGSFMQATALVASGPLMWLLTLIAFDVSFRYRPAAMRLFWALLALTLLLCLGDALAQTGLLFDAQPPASLSSRDLLSGPLGRLLFIFNVYVLNVGLMFYVGWVYWQRQTPYDMKQLSGMILILVLVIYGAFVVTGAQSPLTFALVVPTAVLIGTVFTLLLERAFSPMRFAYHHLINLDTVGLLVFDARGLLLEANDTAVRRLSLTQDALRGQQLSAIWQTITAPSANAAELQSHFNDGLTNAAPALRAELRLATDAAAERHLFLSLERIQTRNGRFLGHLLVIEDHTQAQQQRLHLQQTNAELVAQTRFLTLLAGLTQTAIASLDFQEMLQSLADNFGEIINADGCYITLWDEEQKRVLPGAAYSPLRHTYHIHSPQTKEKTLTEHVLSEGRGLAVEDTYNTPYLSMRIAQAFPSRSILALPLIVNETKLGAVLIAFDEPRHFSAQEIARGEQAAAQIALAIAKTRLLESERAQRLLAQTLQESGATLAAMLDFDAILDELLNQIGRVVPFDTACVLITTPQTGYEFGRLHGYERFTDDLPGFLAELKPCLSEWRALRQMAHTHETVVIPDVHNSDYWTPVDLLRYINSWVGTPVIVKGEVLAFLCLDHTTPNFYQAEHGLRLAAFAGQVGLAMQNAQLFTATRRSAQEIAFVAHITRYLNGTPQVETALAQIWPYLQQITGCQCAALWLKREATFEVWPLTHEVIERPQEQFLLAETAVSPHLTHAHPYLTPDLSAEADYATEQNLLQAGLRSRILFPLHINNRLMGGLHLSWTEPNGYNEHFFPVLTQIAESLALAIERSRLFQETRQHANELGILAEISAITRTAENTEEMAYPVLYQAIQALRATYGAIFLRDIHANEMVLAAAHSPTPNLPKILHPPEQSIARRVLETGQVYQTFNIAQDPYFWPGAAEIENIEQIKSLVVIPLRTQDQRVGLMYIATATPRHFAPEDMRLLTAIGDILANALHRLQVLATLEERVVRRTQQLATANERLQELDQLKSKFIADVSHELRTPITNLTLYLDLLTRGRPERRHHYEEVLHEQLRRLQNLIDDTLSLSRLELGHDQSRYEFVSLNRVVSQVVAMHQVKADAVGLQLTFNPTYPLPKVWGESNQLAQVVSNLVVNALNYTQQGFVRVGTGYETAVNNIILQVEDSGQGIAAEDAPYLFQRFYRGQQTGQSNIPGTGLGLAIVKEMVGQYGGEIEVHSQVNIGSRFVVKLPVKGIEFETFEASDNYSPP